MYLQTFFKGGFGMFKGKYTSRIFSGVMLAGVSTSVVGYAQGGTDLKVNVEQNQEVKVKNGVLTKLTSKAFIGTAFAGIIFYLLIKKGIPHFKSYLIASKLRDEHIDEVVKNINNFGKLEMKDVVNNNKDVNIGENLIEEKTDVNVNNSANTAYDKVNTNNEVVKENNGVVKLKEEKTNGKVNDFENKARDGVNTNNKAAEVSNKVAEPVKKKIDDSKINNVEEEVKEIAKELDLKEVNSKVDDIITEAIEGKNNLLKVVESSHESVFDENGKLYTRAYDLGGDEGYYCSLLHDAGSALYHTIERVVNFQKKYYNYLKNFAKYVDFYEQYEKMMERYYTIRNKFDWVVKEEGFNYAVSKGFKKIVDDAEKEVEKFYEERIKGFFSFLRSYRYLIWKYSFEKDDDIVTAYNNQYDVGFAVRSLKDSVKRIRKFRESGVTDKCILDKNKKDKRYCLPVNINELNIVIDNLESFEEKVDLRKRFDLPEKVKIPKQLEDFKYGARDFFVDLSDKLRFPKRTVWYASSADREQLNRGTFSIS